MGKPMTDISFLFRYRDLVAASLEEHRKIITEHGWCWWGWWKRPSEDSRSDIWRELEQQTEAGQPVPVGLFDSGSGKVYRALVAGIIEPDSSGAAGIDSAINVPPEESKNVPPYYRDSPFSRAWMKITQIDEKEIDFFEKYSFAEAPKLLNYEKSTLVRFVNKKIATAEELRMMDTTIWRIRPSRPGDPSDQILLGVRLLADPISIEIVRCKSDAILHLTDSHFAIGGNRRQHVWRLESETAETRYSMISAVTSALNRRKIGLVIISGDFTFIGNPAEFTEAQTAILRLLGILDLSLDHLVIIPGNHDIQWTTNAIYDPNEEVKRASPEAKNNYIEFYRNLLRHEPNSYLSMGRRFVLPCGITLEVCGLNSSSLETGKNFLAGMGRIEEEAFSEVAGQLGWDDARTLALRLLVIHHHLALTEDLEPAEGYGKGYGLAVDAVRVQRLAAQKGVHLALHVHKHRAFIWRSTVYQLPEFTEPEYRLGELSIIGGGSAGSVETDSESNYFNVITIEPGKLKLEIFRSRQLRQFGKIQGWEADLTLSPDSGGLKMSDWKKVA